MTWQDPIVDDVRGTREALSAKFGFDVHAIFADLRARQSSVGDRLVRLQSQPDTELTTPSGGVADPVPSR